MVYVKPYRLYRFHELPAFLQHNEFILTSYRYNLNLIQTFISSFHIHNGKLDLLPLCLNKKIKPFYYNPETLNIWTHLIAVALFAGLMINSLLTWLSEGDWIDRLIFLVFVLSAQSLLLGSTIFHLFCGFGGAQHYRYFARLDYVGISVLIGKRHSLS
jgi:predicted membrane channel-forming protein YqfA (hemolysin III family)